MSINIGLTGSIGMGKSTTAGFFRDAGVPVWDADAAVHQLYAPGGGGARAIAVLCPDAVTDEGVDRAKLRAAIMADESLMPRIEAAIHPLVAQDRADFIAGTPDAPLRLFDIPLLFETGADGWLDHIVVVTAPTEVQRSRVLARPGMTEEAFHGILARQTPDADKRARADTVIDTSHGIEAARAAVHTLIARLTGVPHA
ncbi:dephospho-CoA kinase [Rubricella aquisinus]|uniref:Dephospho-CoA kinase n=1 Tax=Rubricella aquisinus TaxID=2028108 RepID=A0A840WIZ5_9RHOB|nr:dephospho-CoA kinase [Rubricella aquisinus]MBB5514481.1 dephospho-CoA kinase [Rubricella aquisinus]